MLATSKHRYLEESYKYTATKNVVATVWQILCHVPVSESNFARLINNSFIAAARGREGDDLLQQKLQRKTLEDEETNSKVQ